MAFESTLTTAKMLQAFTDAICSRGGNVTDAFDDGARLFTRSVLPQIKNVRKKDRLQGGVALKGISGEVWLHPYTFRLVCSNGAIMAQTLETQHLASLDTFSLDVAMRTIQEAVEACCADEVFSHSVRQMRTACEMKVDLVLNLMPLLSQVAQSDGGRFMPEIMNRFFEQKDDTRFGLINAVTSIARDTPDPAARWNLEEFAGRLAIAPVPPARSKRAAALEPSRGYSLAAR